MPINAYFDFGVNIGIFESKNAFFSVLSQPHFIYINNVKTLWETWLTAAGYYNKHFAGAKAVINSFSADESIAMRRYT